MSDTTLRRFADHLLRGKLDEVVTEQRAGGRSWETIARELYVKTTGQINLSGRTLRNWYGP